jgi:hypothetical protein
MSVHVDRDISTFREQAVTCLRYRPFMIHVHIGAKDWHHIVSVGQLQVSHWNLNDPRRYTIGDINCGGQGQCDVMIYHSYMVRPLLKVTENWREVDG